MYPRHCQSQPTIGTRRQLSFVFLWPFVKRRYTLALFKDTGYWGKEMYLGYYKQPVTWLLEGTVIAFFLYRLVQIRVI